MHAFYSFRITTYLEIANSLISFNIVHPVRYKSVLTVQTDKYTHTHTHTHTHFVITTKSFNPSTPTCLYSDLQHTPTNSLLQLLCTYPPILHQILTNSRQCRYTVAMIWQLHYCLCKCTLPDDRPVRLGTCRSSRIRIQTASRLTSLVDYQLTSELVYSIAHVSTE